MDDKTKLYVFEKKELALVFIFMILISLTSFMFGVRIGKEYTYQEAGYTAEDQHTIDQLAKNPNMIDIQSEQEEEVSEIVEKSSESAAPKKVTREEKDVLKKDIDQRLEQKILDELNDQAPPAEKEEVEAAAEEPAAKPAKKVVERTKKDKFSGKHSIQIGAYQSIAEAQKYADAFRVRGYDPIITEKEDRNKGIWFAISIGVFDSVHLAKEYMLKEKTLFEGIDDAFFIEFD